MTQLAAADRIIDPLEHLLGYQLRRASAAMMADLAMTLGGFGLSAAQASVLLVVRANRDATQSQVGRCLGIKRANMAPLIADLTSRGLVARSPVDGRSQALTLTDAGYALANRIHADIDAHEARFLSNRPPEDRRRLIALLREIRQSTTTQEEGAAA